MSESNIYSLDKIVEKILTIPDSVLNSKNFFEIKKYFTTEEIVIIYLMKTSIINEYFNNLDYYRYYLSNFSKLNKELLSKEFIKSYFYDFYRDYDKQIIDFILEMKDTDDIFIPWIEYIDQDKLDNNAIQEINKNETQSSLKSNILEVKSDIIINDEDQYAKQNLKENFNITKDQECKNLLSMFDEVINVILKKDKFMNISDFENAKFHLELDICKMLDKLREGNILNDENVIYLVDNQKRSILHLSIKINSIEVFKNIIKNFNKKLIYQRDIQLRTSLHYVSFVGNTSMLEILFENEINYCLTDSLGRNIVHYAFSGNSIELVKYLFEKLNLTTFEILDNYSRNFSHYLIFNPHKNAEKIMNILVDYCKYNKQFKYTSNFDNEGKCPIHYAIENNKKWAIYGLILLGESPTIFTECQIIPLSLFKKNIKFISKSGLQLCKDDKLRDYILTVYGSKSVLKKSIQNEEKSKINKKSLSSINDGSLDELYETIYAKARSDIKREEIQRKINEENKIRQMYKEIIYGINNGMYTNRNVSENENKNVNNIKFDKELYEIFVNNRKEKVENFLDILQVNDVYKKDTKYFTGSWLENINSPGELIDFLSNSNLNKSEIVTLIYNVLNPVDFEKIEKTKYKLGNGLK